MIGNYELEIEKAVSEINKNNAKRVLLHLPDGLKPEAANIQKYIEDNIEEQIDILIWAGSCFGACDIPVEAKNVGVDLLIHWGHSRWKF